MVCCEVRFRHQPDGGEFNRYFIAMLRFIRKYCSANIPANRGSSRL